MTRGLNQALLTAVCASFVLSACSGGSTASPLPGASPHVPMTTARFTMHWPAAKQPSSLSRRRPKWISPSTRSLAIEVNNDPTLTTIVNNPSSSLHGAISSVTIQAPPGNDSITFSLFDASNAGGNELCQTTVGATIDAGKANTINATLDGIVNSVALTPLSNQPTVSATPDASGATQYTIAGDIPVIFAATPEDADGNIILGPGDPITITARSTNPAVAVTPVSGHANQVAVQPVAPPATGSSVGIIVQASDTAGDTAQSNYDVSLAALMYVAYENSGSGTIAAFDATGKKLILSGSFSGLTDPIGIAYDTTDHRLFALDRTSSDLLAFTSSGASAPGFAPVHIPGATALAFDANNGTVYVTTATTVLAFTSAGAPVVLTGTWPNLSTPVGIVFAPANTQLYVANKGNNTISWYHEDGTAGFTSEIVRHPFFSTGTLVPAGIGSNAPTASPIVAGNNGADILEQFVVTGASIGTTTASLSGPEGVAFNSLDGNIYVANNTSGTITSYDPALAGLLATVVAPSGFAKPTSVTFVF